MRNDHHIELEQIASQVSRDLSLGEFMDFWLGFRAKKKELSVLSDQIGQMCYDHMEACEAGNEPACIAEARVERERMRKELDESVREFINKHPK